MTEHIHSILNANDSNHDKGATALVVALCMVVLLGFAALAVDATGLGFNERRQDQSAADVGALAAVQFAVTTNLGNGCSGTNSQIARCNGANEAIEVANATLDNPSLADWTDATKCATPPAGYTATAVSPCVAFNSNLDRAWVRIPTITNDTTIARTIGIDSISTSADAIAGTEYDPPGGVLPFLLPGNAAGSDYNCLKAAANPNFGPCEDLPVVGNFGSADIFLYGNSFLEYTAQCTGDSNGRLTANIARGADHPLTEYVAPGPEVQEWANCPIAGAQPNTLNGQPGVGSGLESGLAYGGTAYAANAYPGAIQDTSGFTVRNAGGPKAAVQLDDIPLWDYLLTDPQGSACDTVTNPVEMDGCLNWAKGAGIEVFDPSLADAKRFGWVPELLEADFTGNPYHIVGFRPVYLDTTYYSCNATQCVIMHTPGVSDTGACIADPPDTRVTCGTPGNWNKDMAAVTAYVLSTAIVPEAAKAPPPGSPNQRTYNLID
ncbi:MAG TPA: TadE/TadG family type IV pilus assembly protein [Acidimicrobiia bacterium]